VPDADLSIGAPERPQVTADDEPPIPPEQLGTLDEHGMLAPVPDVVTEAQVRTVLSGMVGPMLGLFFGDEDVPRHWRFTDDELDELVPPVTRVANRRPALRRAISRGDEGAILITLAGYAGSNAAKGQAARRARHAREANDEEAMSDAGEREAGDAVARAAHPTAGPGGAAAPDGRTPRGFPRPPGR